MLKIGMDKTDKQFRKFEYDDERMFGNPQVFKVLYEESGLFGEVLCSNVISIKKSINTHNHFLDIPVYNEVKNTTTSKPEKIVENVVKTETTEEKKKTKSTKTKTLLKSTSEIEPIEIKDPIPISNLLPLTLPKTYEYEILVIDNISEIDDIKYKLNAFGKDGWEVCGFQIIQKIFGAGSQAIIIMKKGLI
jgi:hypothetical protein